MSTIEGISIEDYGLDAKRSSELDIAAFSAMVLSPENPTTTTPAAAAPLPPASRPPRPKPRRKENEDDYDADEDENQMDESSEWTEEDTESWWDFVSRWLDPTDYLMQDAKIGTDGKPYFDRYEEQWWSLAATVRHVFYNPREPEFTSLQQFSWAVVIGVVMGVYVSFWKSLIEGGVDFMWKTLPAELLRLGVFTDIHGSFPLYHYMWICPAVWGGILSYLFVILPFTIPDQNEWITGVHSKGILDHRGFVALFILSTLAMMSGLSLGPELPLVLTAGMVGSWFGLLCKQSMLQARVLNLTAASAAVGGFFGFPMAGAVFVLEIPHRMGLQYFEALSPATISSIVAVLTNRLIINNDVTGYYSYPFLSASLPSEIFTSAIVYGMYGALVGLLYGKGALLFKGYVHEFFQAPSKHIQHITDFSSSKGEETPLMVSSRKKRKKRRPPTPQPTWRERVFGFGCIFIKDEKTRAGLAGFVAGALVGLVGMYLPHTMFWGEAQLQNLIDKGRTPLPIFTSGIEPTAALTARSMCIIDPKDHGAVLQGFGIGCSLLITFAKIVVVGLSLGTGIIGGHFWGPLFCGCSAAHLFTDVSVWLSKTYGVGASLSSYPCVVILCTMGSAHVVTYRAHMAIMLILTLTISAFNPQNETEGVGVVGVSGDYSAVFPLLVVSVFVALMISRSFVFYNAQRSRGDILAVPEVLCEPGMKGRPAVIEYMDGSDDEDFDDDEGYAYMVSTAKETVPHEKVHVNIAGADYEATQVCPPPKRSPTQLDIEWGFAKTNAETPLIENSKKEESPNLDLFLTARLDELLKEPLETNAEPPQTNHRRFHSAPSIPRDDVRGRSISPKRPHTGNRERADSGNLRKHMLRINSYGEIHEHQPSLMDQARERSASSAADSLHRRVPSIDANDTKQHQHHRRIPSSPGLPRKSSTDGSVGALSIESGKRHRRKTSNESIDSDQHKMMEETGALTLDDIEQSFDQVVAARQSDLSSNMWTPNSLS
jgi:H+/Cl- antiporter ClcA